MDIVVCIKRVPQTAEAEVKIDSSGKDILKDRLTFDINESDNYALEEAILLKEKFGGTVTLISLGEQETEDVLRMGIAKGADAAVRITDEKFTGMDGMAIAETLAPVIKSIHFDMVITGCISTDAGYSQVGPVLAELLGIPHATLVSKMEVEGDRVKAQRELEGGLLESVDIKLPAVITLQTGINEPRYASLPAIRRAASKEIKVVSGKELGIESPNSKTKIEILFAPPVGKRAEIIAGSADEASTKLVGIFKDKGLL